MKKAVSSPAPLKLSCPACRTTLRLRGRPADPRQFDCPECHRKLELFEQDGTLLLRVAAPVVEPKPARPASRVIPTATFAPLATLSANPWSRFRSWFSRFGASLSRWSTDPLLVTWTVAGLAAVGIGIAFWQLQRESREEERPTVASENVSGQPDLTDDSLPPGTAASLLPTEPVEAPRAAIIARQPVEASRPLPSPPPDPKVAIHEALSQRLLRFEQPTPVAFDQLRFQMEEMIGVAIRYSPDVAADVREQNVTLSIEAATFGEAIFTLASKVGLTPQVGDEGLTLVPADSEPGTTTRINDADTRVPQTAADDDGTR